MAAIGAKIERRLDGYETAENGREGGAPGRLARQLSAADF
jgi:hypothetical protein